ncbi:MAG: LptF/LptG family permease [bacterium]
MRKISRYILAEHVGPFIFAFSITTFLLIVDLIPKAVDHVIDKDLGVGVVFEIIGYNLAWMLALSVPMSVLVATLMAFGRLSSDFEITAIKASGINLVRVLVPVIVAAGVIMVGMIYFNDHVLPGLNRKARLLWGDISAMRPTLIFRSGAFITDIPGYLILVDKVNHVTSRVDGVHITDSREATKPCIVVAEYGFLENHEGSTDMTFTLYNGEIYTLDFAEPEKDRKVNFDNYVINVSDARSELVRTDRSTPNDREMSIDEMRAKVETAQQAIGPYRTQAKAHMAGVWQLFSDDDWSIKAGGEPMTDSTAYAHVKGKAAAASSQMNRLYQNIKASQKTHDQYSIEIHKKYAIPAASVIFIIIGAPLAILSRRGGMGVAIAISIAMFIIYWAFLIGGEDLADRGLISPFLSMWAANLLMGAVGIYLLYIVVSEKPIFFILGSRRKFS